METSGKKSSFIKMAGWGQALLSICKGALIGVGAILPGISGGVLCVVFGIYKPMMNFLSHPVKAFKTYYRLLLPVLIGWLIGFLLLARAVDVLFRASGAMAIWLFIGLIAGTIPSLFRTAGETGRTAGSWLALGISFAIFLGWMAFLWLNASVHIEPSLFWWLVCGMLWGIGLIVPGLSPSAFLIFLGLYQPMTAGIADLSPEVIIPLIIGVAAVVLLLSRLINRLFERSHSIVFHALTGIVIASTIAIIPIDASYTLLNCLMYALCFLAGCGTTLWMDRLGRKLSQANPGNIGDAQTNVENEQVI